MDLCTLLLADPPPARGVDIGPRAEGARMSWPPALTADQWCVLSDRDALVRDPRPLVAALEVPDEPVGLVIDHATSDATAAALRLFEVSFARLAPGGLHVIVGGLSASSTMELMLVSVARPELVAGVTAMPEITIVQRGPWPSVPESLVFDDLRSDPFGIVSR
jgi:hypothetical protein